MFQWAAPRNCRSVAEQVWLTAALLFPPMTRTRRTHSDQRHGESRSRSDAGLHAPFFGPLQVRLHHPFGCEADAL